MKGKETGITNLFMCRNRNIFTNILFSSYWPKIFIAKSRNILEHQAVLLSVKQFPIIMLKLVVKMYVKLIEYSEQNLRQNLQAASSDHGSDAVEDTQNSSANKKLSRCAFLIVKNAYQTKCTPSLTHPTHPTTTLTHPTQPTTTHEFYWGLFYTNSPPG